VGSPGNGNGGAVLVNLCGGRAETRDRLTRVLEADKWGTGPPFSDARLSNAASFLSETGGR
jgi:hypothetical protein